MSLAPTSKSARIATIATRPVVTQSQILFTVLFINSRLSPLSSIKTGTAAASPPLLYTYINIHGNVYDPLCPSSAAHNSYYVVPYTKFNCALLSIRLFYCSPKAPSRWFLKKSSPRVTLCCPYFVLFCRIVSREKAGSFFSFGLLFSVMYAILVMLKNRIAVIVTTDFPRHNMNYVRAFLYPK